MKRIFSAALLITLSFICFVSAYAAEDEADVNAEDKIEVGSREISDEIERRAGELSLGEWQRYYEEACMQRVFSFNSAADMVIHYAENGAEEDPESLLEILLALIKSKLSGALAVAASLSAAALITGTASALPDNGIKPTAVFALSSAALLMTAAVLASLCSAAAKCVQKTSGFIGAALPVMTAVMTSSGSVSSAGVFRPLMLILSSTLPAFIEKLILPLIITGGIVNMIDCICENGKLSELVKLLQKAVKWLMGAAAVLYFGVCAVQGLTASAADSVALRTARYAADSLMPSTGGFIGGTAEVFLSCASLVKNGAGVTSVLIMVFLIAEPLIAIATGAFVLRAAAAVGRTASQANVAKMLSGAADTASSLFGAAAVAAGMYILTVLIFIASGGNAAGTW